MGSCCASSNKPSEILIKKFESNLPFPRISLQDYEERVKRLIYEDDDE